MVERLVKSDWMSTGPQDILGRQIKLGDRVVRAMSADRATNIEIVVVTRLDNGRVYCGNSKVPLNYPGRVLVVNEVFGDKKTEDDYDDSKPTFRRELFIEEPNVQEERPDDIASRVRMIVIEQLGFAHNVELSPNAMFVEDLGADSLDLVELVMVLEDEFRIEIDYREAESCISLGQAIELIKRRVK